VPIAAISPAHPFAKGGDMGEVMPPKSTWFEPKLRDGILVYQI